MSARIACRAGTSFRSSASIVGLSVALAIGFLGLSPRSATAATFTPVIEEFEIVRGSTSGTTSFLDDFNGGGVPPAGPDGATTYSVTGPSGMTGESGGRLTMTPSLGVPTSGVGSADTITRALRLASTNPNGANHLGKANSVQVRGLFNIALPNTVPTINGQSFGIRLQDGTLPNQFYPAGTPTNDIASLDLGRNAAGQLRIRYAEVDLVADENQTVDFVNISIPLGAAFIELILSKDADSATPVASYRILDITMAIVLAAGTFDTINNVTGLPITLFNGEAFTRAAFYSTDAVPLPGALPLFATVLAGGGLMAWRRRRKAARQHA